MLRIKAGIEMLIGCFIFMENLRISVICYNIPRKIDSKSAENNLIL